VLTEFRLRPAKPARYNAHEQTKPNAKEHPMRNPTAIAAIIAAVSAGALALALGPLDPPAGPVAETSPSLADLQTDLDEITLNLSGSAVTAGPFESFIAPNTGNFLSDLNGELIAEGRVYVHSISATFGIAAVFDGPGTIDSNGRPQSGSPVARVYHNYVASGSGIGAQYTTVTTPIEQVVENGLYAAWFARETNGFVTIRFKRLSALPLQGAAE